MAHCTTCTCPPTHTSINVHGPNVSCECGHPLILLTPEQAATAIQWTNDFSRATPLQHEIMAAHTAHRAEAEAPL